MLTIFLSDLGVSIRVFLLPLLAGCLAIMSSCKDGTTAKDYFKKQREQSQRVREHFEKSEERFVDLKARVRAKFEGTPYQLEISQAFLDGPIKKEKIYSEDLLALKFGYLVQVEGAETEEEIQAVKKGIQEVVTEEEWKAMQLMLVTGEVDGVKQLQFLNTDTP